VSEATPSKQLCAPKTVEAHVGAQSWMSKQGVFHYKMDRLLELIDPHVYGQYVKAQSKLRQESPAIHATWANFSSSFGGIATIFNKQTDRHRDTNSAKNGADLLYTLGKFKGGDLFLEALNVRMSYGPNTLVVLRGSLLYHKVLPFEGEQRICLAYYFHETVLQAKNCVPRFARKVVHTANPLSAFWIKR
jgi:hypothetical protein